MGLECALLPETPPSDRLMTPIHKRYNTRPYMYSRRPSRQTNNANSWPCASRRYNTRPYMYNRRPSPTSDTTRDHTCAMQMPHWSHGPYMSKGDPAAKNKSDYWSNIHDNRRFTSDQHATIHTTGDHAKPIKRSQSTSDHTASFLFRQTRTPRSRPGRRPRIHKSKPPSTLLLTYRLPCNLSTPNKGRHGVSATTMIVRCGPLSTFKSTALEVI